MKIPGLITLLLLFSFTAFSQQWNEIDFLEGTGTNGLDFFGTSVDINDDKSVIGAPREDDNGSNSGAAYIFYQAPNSGQWSEVKKLLAPDGFAGDNFGTDVAICGEWALVGAPGCDDNGNLSGAAYLFHKDTGGMDNWGFVKKIFQSNPSASDYFGEAVSLEDSILLISASRKADSAISAGAAYLFTQNTGGPVNWGQLQMLLPDSTYAGAFFGFSCDIADGRAFLGSKAYKLNGKETGAVFLYEDAGNGNYVLIKAFNAPDSEAGDEFGFSLSAEDSLLAVGSPYHSELDTSAGAVYLFQQNRGGANNWGLFDKVQSPEADSSDVFGYSVAVSHNYLLVGAPWNRDSGDFTGSSYVFETGASVIFINKLMASNGAAGEEYGFSVALDSTTGIVGARYYGGFSFAAGAAYIVSNENLLAGTEEKLIDENLNIFPNPVNNYINFTRLEQAEAYIIADMKGTVVKSGPIQQPRINCSELNKGLYLLMIRNKNGVQNAFKFIKQ